MNSVVFAVRNLIMQDRSISHFLEAHLLSGLIYALILFLFIRFAMSLWQYKSAQDQLKGSWSVVVWLLVSIIYVISPVDLIPDILVVVGWIDDTFILVSSIAFVHSVAKKIFWGELPREDRFTNFLLWYGVSFFIVTSLRVLIYLL